MESAALFWIEKNSAVDKQQKRNAVMNGMVWTRSQMAKRADQQGKRIISLILSAVLTLLCVLSLKNSKVVEAADNIVLLEKRHPGYWKWFHENTAEVDIDNDKRVDFVGFPISKKYLSEISDDDYHFFLNVTGRDGHRRLIYFLDGTGIDMNTSLYGDVDTSSWMVSNGIKVGNLTDITCEDKEMPIKEITDIYEYLDALQDYSFIISARDDADGRWDKTLQNLLENLGLSGGFYFRGSYIAIVDNDENLYEEANDPVGAYAGTIQGHEVLVKSSGYNNGAISEIVIDGVDYSKKGRGLNIVVMKNGNIVDSVNFDTCYWALTCYR